MRVRFIAFCLQVHVLASVFVCEHTHTYEVCGSGCVCLSMFFWSETAGSDCPVFPFPLWLITRVPVNPWYHHRIKRRPPSPREPISSESRTQTGKLLDIFAGPGMVKTSGLEDAAWHHGSVGRGPFCKQHTQTHKPKKLKHKTMTWALETGHYDKRREKVGIEGKKDRDRDPIVKTCICQLQWLYSS